MGKQRLKKCMYCTPETGRHPGCHDTCEHYAEDKAADEAEKEKIRKTKDAEALATNTAVRLREKRRREFNA